ncbi:MAG TPA: hypothetical protein VE423_05460 [Microvirga sp.]|nr:hypothetical protein [Microvirga sp.]
MPKAGFARWDENDAFDLYDERPSRHGRKRRLPWLRMGFFSVLCIAGLVFFAQEYEQKDHEPKQPAAAAALPAPVLTAPTPVWRQIPPQPVLYAFERTADPVAMTARQHAGGAREDTLILGGFGEERYAHVALAHNPAGPLAEPARSFFVELVRRSAEAGLSVVRYPQSHMVATKFGPVEAAPVTLAAAAEQACLAFRFSDAAAGFGLQGWLCGSEARPVDDAQLACFLDGIGLAGAAGPGLKAIFARSEHSRIEACGPVARTASASVKAPVRP